MLLKLLVKARLNSDSAIEWFTLSGVTHIPTTLRKNGVLYASSTFSSIYKCSVLLGVGISLNRICPTYPSFMFVPFPAMS